MEKILKPMSGYLALIISLAVLAVAIWLFVRGIQSFDRGGNGGVQITLAIISFIAFIFFIKTMVFSLSIHCMVLKK